MGQSLKRRVEVDINGEWLPAVDGFKYLNVGDRIRFPIPPLEEVLNSDCPDWPIEHYQYVWIVCTPPEPCDCGDEECRIYKTQIEVAVDADGHYINVPI